MRNRLIAASAILQEDYKSAEEPLKSLMDSIGEDMSLFDVLEKWKQIHDKESKINLLTTRLNALEERYEELKDIHEKQEQQYEEEHKIIERYHQEAAELERQKEIKAAEIQKIKELKSYSEKLQKEVNELTKTKEKLQDDQKERNEQIRKQFEEGFSNMKGEVKSLEDELSDTNKQNEALEEELNNIKPQYEETKSDREKVENTLNELQEDYKKILETFSAMADSLDYDPFEDQRFLVFLSQMSEKSWTPETVKKYSNSIEKLTAMLDEQKEKLAKYESTEDILNKRITTKRQKISTLEEQLKNLSQNLDQNDNDKRKNSDYTRSAIHIKSFESPNKVGQGLVEIVIYFGNFKPSPSIAKKDSKFFISLSLFDQDPKETQYIDPTLGFFDSKLSFICKNDFVLKVYIEKGSIFAQFCRVADGRTSKIGQVELILSPFIEGTRKFTSTAKIMSNSEREIGEVTFEAGISAALAR
ncbi:hypothetical protein GPJ56_006714 [Histomonas meleagridis]|uniref:uncharacterized protein n=1 Tax=Histomonas meleagridis TaxID=135588 RepID=UPI003559EFE4|nr:hypothetical protein GPJ56_006714 [Histomonas meleagridis]KAH0806459.1 hypothetical protein GO595_000621 [Histomonas meleagridis]